MARTLKIAFSVLFATLAVLTAILWFRSYWNQDIVLFHLKTVCLGFKSARAQLELYYSDFETQYHVEVASHRLPSVTFGFLNQQPFTIGGAFPNSVILLVPHSFLVLHFALLAWAPWIRWGKSFRLRTLLYAATYIAVVCGIVAMWR